MLKSKNIYYIAALVTASSISLLNYNSCINKQLKDINYYEEPLIDTFVIKNGTIEYYDENGNNNINSFPIINPEENYSVIEYNSNGTNEIQSYNGKQLAKKLALFWGEGALEYIADEQFPVFEYIAKVDDYNETTAKKIRI